jgi:chromosome segregation ATPase
MSEKANVTQRDKALLAVLERIAGELGDQDILLENIVKSQNEYSKMMHATDIKLDAQRVNTEKLIDKIFDSISHYRSDMLSLVNEQDRINESVNELGKLIKQTTFEIENTNKRISMLEEKIKPLETTISGNYEHSLKHTEITTNLFADMEHNVTMLHAGTEKSLNDLHVETEQQLEKMQQETSRRFLALVGIEAALNTLLIRTEPPVKKTSPIIRMSRRVGVFFRYKLPSRLKQIIF